MHNNLKKMTLRRRFVTLIEMMIVMFLIALITGVVAYNYRGSLDEGKAFKTKAGIERLRNVLDMMAADDPTFDLSGDGWKSAVQKSPLVQDAKSLITDGWGYEYSVARDPDTHNIVITSQKYEAYINSKDKQSMFK